MHRTPRREDHHLNGKHDLPPIATLPVTPSANEEMNHTLAPLRSQTELSAPATQQRRRASTTTSTETKRRNGYGSKIVACNFCRGACLSRVLIVFSLGCADRAPRVPLCFVARKTRCDGGHPSCSSCLRRSLPCNYVNDPASGNPKGRPKTATSAGPSSSRSSPLQQGPSPPAFSNGYMHHHHHHQQHLHDQLEAESPPPKKMRIADDYGPVAVASVN